MLILLETKKKGKRKKYFRMPDRSCKRCPSSQIVFNLFSYFENLVIFTTEGLVNCFPISAVFFAKIFFVSILFFLTNSLNALKFSTILISNCVSFLQLNLSLLEVGYLTVDWYNILPGKSLSQ
jgi:hypothetical protein